MEVKNFSQYSLNEASQIPVLDFVIDFDGNIHNGEFIVNNQLLTSKKGRQDLKRINRKVKVVDIKGDDGNSYAAGIDRNGTLVALHTRDTDNFIYRNDIDTRPIQIPQAVIDRYPGIGRNWNTSKDYKNLISILPTGWVNVKIDAEVQKRVKRYANKFGSNDKGVDSFVERLQNLDKVSKGLTKAKRNPETIQKELSTIMLLHYINEIKDFFNPSTSGFLFESFMSGLIPNAKVIDDNSSTDAIADGKRYQFKFYNPTYEYIEVVKKGNPYLEHYYVIAIKYPDKIVIYLLSNNPERVPNSRSRLKVNDIHLFSVESGVKMKALQEFDNKNYVFTLYLNDLDSKIDKIVEGLKEILSNLYNQLSQFQYNVETILSGVNEEGEIIGGRDFNAIQFRCNQNIQEMSRQLNELVKKIKPNIEN